MQTVNIDAHLEAAEGFFELGMLEESHTELDAICEVPEYAVPVNFCRLALFTREGRWHDAGICASNLCQLEPQVPSHFLITASIQRNLGLVGSAIDVLLEGPLSLEGLPEYHYSLATYFALLGESQLAVKSLREAMDLDAKCRERAQTDPDLASIRPLLNNEPEMHPTTAPSNRNR